MSTPPLPAGYALDGPPPLPSGYKLDTEQDSPEQSTYKKLTAPEDPGAHNPVSRFFSYIGGKVIGAPEALGKAALHPYDTAEGIRNTVNDALDTYANPKTRPTLEGAASVAPEALGEGVANAALGEVTNAGLGKAAEMVKKTPSLFKVPVHKLDELPPAAKFNPALANTPREVIGHAAQEDIDLTPSQATKAPLQRTIQAIGERSLFGANQLTAGIDRNAGAFMQSVRKFADTADPKALGLSRESAGEAIQQSAQTAKQVAHENASNGYKQIDFLMPEKVNPAPITNKWNALKESLPMGAEDTIRAQVPRNMRAVVEDMLSGKPEGFQPTFEQAIKLRSFFRELGDTERLPNSQQAVFRQMSNAADVAAESTANKIGAADQWRQANAGWKDYTQKYGDTQSPLYKILRTQDPKQITDSILSRRSAADVETLKNEGMSAALEPIKRQVIEDVARNKFGVGKNGLGGYSDAFLNTLFGPQGLKELYLKADIGRRFNWEMNPSGTSNVMLGESQVVHPEPSKLGLLYGAAKVSQPRPALSYLKNRQLTSNPTAGRLAAGIPLSNFLTNGEEQ